MRYMLCLLIAVAMAGCASPGSSQAPPTLAPILDEQAAAFPADEPSLSGPDRSNWSKVELSAYDGRVPHRPTYLKQDWHLKPDRPSPLYFDDADQSRSLTAALGGDRKTLTARDAGQWVVSPLEFGLRLYTLPVRAVVYERPWDVVYSP